MHTKEQLMEMHAEHAEWQNKIRFYRGKLRYMEDELGSTALKSSVHEMPYVEHFQNQFTIQKNVLDIMRHDFKQHENLLEADSKELNLFADHEAHKERLAQFKKLFRELEEDFQKFSQKELELQ